MKLLLAVEAFRTLGGIQEIVDNLAAAYLRVGHRVAIVSNSYFRPEIAREPRALADYFEVELPSAKPLAWRHPERLFSRARAWQFRDCVRGWSPDVVNSHVFQWDKLPPLVAACQRARVPLVQTLYDPKGRGKLGVQALRPLRNASALVTDSMAGRNYFAPLIDAAQNARVIGNGVDLDAAAKAVPFRRDRPYILSVARLNFRSKALDVVVQAFGQLADKFPGVDLLVAGDGPDRIALSAMARAAGLESRVAMVGAVPHDELWSYYRGALFFVLASRIPEGRALVFLEAMAAGLPIVASRSGGTPEIVADDQSGVLIEANEPEMFAAAMRVLLGDAALRRQMGLRARELAEREHGWDAVARRYLDVYASCCAGGPQLQVDAGSLSSQKPTGADKAVDAKRSGA